MQVKKDKTIVPFPLSSTQPVNLSSNPTDPSESLTQKAFRKLQQDLLRHSQPSAPSPPRNTTSFGIVKYSGNLTRNHSKPLAIHPNITQSLIEHPTTKFHQFPPTTEANIVKSPNASALEPNGIHRYGSDRLGTLRQASAPLATAPNRTERVEKLRNGTELTVTLEYPWPVKKEAVVEGDIILGGLMMVHEREDTITCGPIMPQGGIQALEAMLFTLDRLNVLQLVPNVTLGAHILDDCDKDTYGLEMAVDFIKG